MVAITETLQQKMDHSGACEKGTSQMGQGKHP